MIPDFDTFPAGEELDWLVLHHALDWKLGYPALGQAPYLTETREGASALWPVSSEWKAAERVIRVLERRGFQVDVSPGFVGRVSGPSGTVEAGAETAPLAVARAVMKAVAGLIIVKR